MSYRTLGIAAALASMVLIAGKTLPGATAAPHANPTTAGGTTISGGHSAKYSVTIRCTAGGVPHITANDFGSLGYGVGFSFATDDICSMANDIVTLEGNRSRYFGPNNTYYELLRRRHADQHRQRHYWKGVAKSGLIQREMAARTGPDALSPTIRKLLRGYVDGYNRYLSSVDGANGITDPPAKVGVGSIRSR